MIFCALRCTKILNTYHTVAGVTEALRFCAVPSRSSSGCSLRKNINYMLPSSMGLVSLKFPILPARLFLKVILTPSFSKTQVTVSMRNAGRCC